MKINLFCNMLIMKLKIEEKTRQTERKVSLFLGRIVIEFKGKKSFNSYFESEVYTNVLFSYCPVPVVSNVVAKLPGK